MDKEKPVDAHGPEAHGGIWGEHPDHPVSDWRHEAADDNTRLGYWEWVKHQCVVDTL